MAGTTLDADLTAIGTTATVVSTSDFPSTGTIGIEGEIMTYSGKTATTFTGLTRAQYGTTASRHDDGNNVGEVYISSWQDTDGWNSIELFIATDVVSQAQGIIYQFTDNTQAGTPTIRATEFTVFDNEDVEKTFKIS